MEESSKNFGNFLLFRRFVTIAELLTITYILCFLTFLIHNCTINVAFARNRRMKSFLAKFLFVKRMVAVLFFVVLLCMNLSCLADISARIVQPGVNNFASCTSSQVYDSATQICRTCASSIDNSSANPSLVDGAGNNVGCECGNGYYRRLNTEACISGRNCYTFSCEACNSSFPASYEDFSGCAACDPSTATESSKKYFFWWY
jgi:hypothetical protein